MERHSEQRIGGGPVRARPWRSGFPVPFAASAFEALFHVPSTRWQHYGIRIILVKKGIPKMLAKRERLALVLVHLQALNKVSVWSSEKVAETNTLGKARECLAKGLFIAL